MVSWFSGKIQADANANEPGWSRFHLVVRRNGKKSKLSSFFLLLLAMAFPSMAGAVTVTGCGGFGVFPPLQACIGSQRIWQMTGDDTVAPRPGGPSTPIVINVVGPTVDFTAAANIPSPGIGGGLFNFDKFYIITDNAFNSPVRGSLFNEWIGPFSYGLPPVGNAVQFSPAELGRIAAMKLIGNGKLAVLELQTGCTIKLGCDAANGRNGVGTEAFGPVDFAGALPPPLPPKPTPVNGTSEGNTISSGEAADPINTFTGELFKSFPADLDLGGPMPLRFSRYYASGLEVDSINGRMSQNWRNNFEWSLTTNATVTAVADIIDIISNKGRLIRFAKSGAAWQLSGRTDIAYQLVENAATGNFTLVDPRNNMMHIFNAGGQLISIQDSAGNTHTLTYDAAGLLTQVADGLGRVLNFIYVNSNGGKRLQIVDGGNGQRIGFIYDGLGRLMKYIDPLNFGVAGGNATFFSYTGAANVFTGVSIPKNNLLTGIKKPQGNTKFTQTWDANNKVATQTDALGNTTTLSYAASNTTITDALNKVMTHTHTATGELSNVARRDGTSVALASNAAGQRNGITDSLGATTDFAYDTASGRVATTTHANGAATSKTFATRTLASGAKQFDMASIIHADATIDVFTHDAAGNLISHTDRAGNITSFTRKANGQWLTHTNSLGGVVARTFNADATQATITDISGNATTFAYDTLRRPVTTTFADGSTQSVIYDLLNRPMSVTDNRGGVSSMIYDANGNLISSTNRTGSVITLTYDATDKGIKVTDDNGVFSTRSYDALRRLSATTDRNGNSISFAYDTQNRLTAITDGIGNVFSRTFDSEGILTTTTTPLGNVTAFISDTMGRITQISSPLGNNVQMAYNTQGRITSTTDPLGNISSNTYDVRGLVASRTLPDAISASYIRNGLGQITQANDPNGNNWSRTIDTAGRVTASTDPLNRSQSFAYDNRNRISTATFPGGLGTRTNTYDTNGNLIRKLYSDGTDLNSTFDAEDRLLTTNGLNLTRDNLGRITNSNGITVAYDAGGRITRITFAVGKAVNYSYDANDNIKTVTDWIGGTSTFTYDADNRLTAMIRPNGVTTSYTYDIDGRLTGFADGALGSTTLTLNAKGQITAAVRIVPTAASAAGMVTSNHSFDAAAQVSTAGFAYDALGRLTNNGATAFVWDLASRLSSAGTATHTYDGIGYRLSRTTAAGTRNYVWNQALPLPSVSIEKQGMADLRYYVHTPGGALLYSIDAVGKNARHFYHFDETGNTRFVSNDAGAVQASYVYSPFGVLQATTGALDNPFTWQGQGGLFDDGNGLYYVRTRYYDANAGRFLSKDSVKSMMPMMLNPYQYALNSPLIYVDLNSKKPLTKDNMRKSLEKKSTWGDWFLNGASIIGAAKDFCTAPKATLINLTARFISIVSGLDATTGGKISEATGPTVSGVNIADAVLNLAPTILDMASTSAGGAGAGAAGAAEAGLMTIATPFIAVGWVTNTAINRYIKRLNDNNKIEFNCVMIEMRSNLRLVQKIRNHRIKKEANEAFWLLNSDVLNPSATACGCDLLDDGEYTLRSNDSTGK